MNSAARRLLPMAMVAAAFLLGILVGFLASQQFWYKRGAEDVIMMYENFTSGVVRQPDGSPIDFNKNMERIAKNRELLKNVSPELRSWYESQGQ